MGSWAPEGSQLCEVSRCSELRILGSDVLIENFGVLGGRGRGREETTSGLSGRFTPRKADPEARLMLFLPSDINFFLKHCALWVFAAVRASSSCSKWGLLSSCSAGPSPCGGFSCCRAGAVGCTGFSSCGTQAWLPCGKWDHPRPGIKPVPCIGGWVLNCWNTREVPDIDRERERERQPGADAEL